MVALAPSQVPAQFDGQAYEAPADLIAPRAAIVLGAELQLRHLVWFDIDAGLPPVSIDAQGNAAILESRAREGGGVDVVLRRFDAQGNAASDEVIAQTIETEGGFADALYPRSDGGFVVLTNGAPAAAEDTRASSSAFVTTLLPDGSRQIAHVAGPRVQVGGFFVDQQDQAWLRGEFVEWLQVGAAVTLGPLGEDLSFYAKLGADGVVQQLGHAGALPAQLDGFGPSAMQVFRIDFAGHAVLRLPDPAERLSELTPTNDRPSYYRVLRGGDGQLYLDGYADSRHWLARYPDGELLPALPAELDGVYDIALADQQLLALSGISSAEPGTLRAYALDGDEWIQSESIAVPQGDNLGFSDLLVVGNWAFYAYGGPLHALKYEAGRWTPQEQTFGDAWDFDSDGRTLVVGNVAAQGERKRAGQVVVFELQGDSFVRVATLTASDALGSAPAPAYGGGDVVPTPPEGLGLGRFVHVQGDSVLAANQHDTFYRYVRGSDGSWSEQDIVHLPGDPIVFGERILLLDQHEDRGAQTYAGAATLLEHGDSGWAPSFRIVPSQRWPSAFGGSWGVTGDRLLIGAQNHRRRGGNLNLQTDPSPGAVFQIPLRDCAAR